jgi:hypothetical protein
MKHRCGPLLHLGPPIEAPIGGITVRIVEDARKCIVFFGKASFPDGEIKFGGTGFLLCDRERENVPYLITARHVAKLLEDDFVIRVNKHGGGSVPLEVTNVKWSYHSDPTVDVAATVLPLNSNIYDVHYYTLKLIQPYSRRDVLCGDPVALVGLFRLHAGSKRNVPIVHTGHIASLPDPNEKIPIRDRMTGEIVEVESYLVEAQTLDGLSGSPVYISQFEEVPLVRTPGGGPALAYGDRKLLGVYQGAWDGEPGRILAADKNLHSDRIRVPVGMGLVVPGERILELIDNDPEFKATREDARRERLKKNAASTDAALARPASDANPSHREDFNSLLGAAAKTRVREG